MGVGTTFTLFMPRHVGVAEHAAGQAAEVDASCSNGCAVLVVEDNPDVGAFAEDLLTELGYTVTLVASATAAIAELAKDAVAFDVVFSDVEMAGMSGLELAARLKTTHPALPVVLTSGYSHNLYEHGLRNNELLHKPYSMAQLADVMRRKTMAVAV